MSRKYLGGFVNNCIKEDVNVFTDRILIEYEKVDSKNICLPRIPKDEQYKIMSYYNIDFVPTFKTNVRKDSGLDMKEYLLENSDNNVILKPPMGALARGIYLMSYTDLMAYIEDGSKPESFHTIGERLKLISSENDLGYEFENILHDGVWSPYVSFKKEYRVYLFLNTEYLVIQDRYYKIDVGDFGEAIQLLTMFSELDLDLKKHLYTVRNFMSDNRIPFLALDIIEDDIGSYRMLEFSGELALQENISIDAFTFMRNQTRDSINFLTMDCE